MVTTAVIQGDGHVTNAYAIGDSKTSAPARPRSVTVTNTKTLFPLARSFKRAKEKYMWKFINRFFDKGHIKAELAKRFLESEKSSVVFIADIESSREFDTETFDSYAKALQWATARATWKVGIDTDLREVKIFAKREGGEKLFEITHIVFDSHITVTKQVIR